MSILIKSAEILDPSSSFYKQKKNIFIENGKITDISSVNHKAATVIESGNLKVSPGWLDMRVTSGDPGYEHREDIISLGNAAAFGGFTDVLCMPVTKPAIQSKETINYIKSKSAFQLVDVHPAAAVTLDRQGKELCEMIDLHHAGAIAFTDGDKPVWHTDILLKTLQYLQTFGGLLISHAEELQLTHAGQMNEGIESTMLGLKGLPKLAEELMVQRDIEVIKYTGGKIHFSCVSSPASVELIKKAKAEGLSVSCDVAGYQLILDDSALRSFDTNLKVNPPLRTKHDIELLWKALDEGTIDAIVSDHIPYDDENKNMEFDLAEFGMTGLETLFGMLCTMGKGRISYERLIELLCINPRKILSLPPIKIELNSEARLTLFDPDVSWNYAENTIHSKSKNSPFIGSTFTGKAIAVINKGKVIMN